MRHDPIVEEVRKIREEQSARFDHDLERIYRHFKELEAISGRRYVSYPPRRPEHPAHSQREPSEAARKQ